MSKKYWLCSASASRMPQTHVLARSVRQHMPSHEFGHLDPGEATKAVPWIELRVTIQRLGAAYKLLKEGASEVIISGADYLVCSPLGELTVDYAHYAALFCPHTIQLLPDSPAQQNVNLTRAGVINSDFQVWRNTLAVREFLRSVLAELRGPLERFRDAFDFEQLWLPYALSCCGGGLITHAGYGGAYYNLHERRILQGTDGAYAIDTRERNVPLRTFHFSGMEFKGGARILTRYDHPFGRPLTPGEHSFITEYRANVKRACADLGQKED